ncbi:MAG: WG repeat-containing protein [Flavobacteriales bacterium]
MKLVIEHQYSSVSDFRSKRSIVELNGKKGVIDLLGAYIIPMNYDQIIYQEKEQTYLLEIDGKFGMMNRNGDTIIDFKYDLLSNLKENRILFSAEGKYGWK